MIRTIRTIAASFAVSAFLTTGLGWIYIARADAQVQRCEEDMPCWDCETMGNQVCGPVGHPVEIIIGTPPVKVGIAPSLEDLMMGGALDGTR